jgi:hypothetical protein
MSFTRIRNFLLDRIRIQNKYQVRTGSLECTGTTLGTGIKCSLKITPPLTLIPILLNTVIRKGSVTRLSALNQFTVIKSRVVDRDPDSMTLVLAKSSITSCICAKRGQM